jgi:hypothetical protein
MLGSFLGTYKWIVSGTPLPHKEHSMQGIMAFLEIETKTKIAPEYPYWRSAYYNEMREQLFWRNTKETAEAGKYIPPVVEEVIFLTHTPVEKALYRTAELRGV